VTTVDIMKDRDAAYDMALYGAERVGDTEYRLRDVDGDWFFRQHPSGAG
jgi:hypothetical protein